MTQVNWDEFRCRCSGIKKIMSNKQGTAPISEAGLRKIAEYEARVKPMTENMKLEYAELVEKRERPPKVELSDTCIEYLMEVYAWETEQMISVSKESLDVMAMRKGKMTEFDGLTMLCKVDKLIYKEHKERIGNEFLTGEIDSYLGKSVMEATNVTDIKSAFDYPLFLKKINNGLEPGQKEQLQGYGDITGATELCIANILVDNPPEIIEEMKYRVAKKFGAVTIESPEFLQEWEKWERSMIFSHIPDRLRLYKIPVEPFTDFERQKVYDRVKFCREWLWKFDETYQKLNIPVALLEEHGIS